MRGYRAALAWVTCVTHQPSLQTFAQKVRRRVVGLGARASPTYLQDMAWSADGSRLAACFSGEQSIRVWDADLLVARDHVGAQPPHRVVRSHLAFLVHCRSPTKNYSVIVRRTYMLCRRAVHSHPAVVATVVVRCACVCSAGCCSSVPRRRAPPCVVAHGCVSIRRPLNGWARHGVGY